MNIILELANISAGQASNISTEHKSLVRAVAKIYLRKCLKHTSWQAMLSKNSLRKAALSGNFYHLPLWVQGKVLGYYYRIPSKYRLPAPSLTQMLERDLY